VGVMPAVSQAQRGYLAHKFGPEWMREHHYDNPGKLPAHVSRTKAVKNAKRNLKKAIS
jgi:hypothetical protein